MVHAGDDVDQGGLAAAGLAEDHDEFVLIDVQVDPFQDAKNAVAGRELLDDAAQRNKHLLPLPGGDAEAFFLDGERPEGRQPFTELLLLLIKALAVFPVDELKTADHFREVPQRDTQHAAHQGTAVIEHTARILPGHGVLNHDACSVPGDETFHAEAVFGADIRKVDRPGLSDRDQPVRVLIQKPHGARFTVEDPREHLQHSGERRGDFFRIQKLFQQLKHDTDKPFVLHSKLRSVPICLYPLTKSNACISPSLRRGEIQHGGRECS